MRFFVVRSLTLTESPRTLNTLTSGLLRTHLDLSVHIYEVLSNKDNIHGS